MPDTPTPAEEAARPSLSYAHVCDGCGLYFESDGAFDERCLRCVALDALREWREAAKAFAELAEVPVGRRTLAQTEAFLDAMERHSKAGAALRSAADTLAESAGKKEG
jgi:hypothetical protein